MRPPPPQPMTPDQPYRALVDAMRRALQIFDNNAGANIGYEAIITRRERCFAERRCLRGTTIGVPEEEKMAAVCAELRGVSREAHRQKSYKEGRQ